MLTQAERTRDFPGLAHMTYLNTAAEGLPPRAVGKALSQYTRDKDLGMDGRLPHQEQWQLLRERTAPFYGLTADEIGICSCSSEAYNLAMLALSLKPGDEVVINDLDFPAGATPWLQPSCAADAKVWRNRDGALRIEDLVALLTPATRIVTVSLVSFFNGFKIPLKAVSEAVRHHSSALLAIDVTQALGRIPLDLQDVDLIVSSTHKWILSAHGGGLVGVPSRQAETITAAAGGWFNIENAFDNDRFDHTVTKPGALSFSVGMPNYAAVYAAAAALDYIDRLGIDAIHAHAQPLVEQCLTGLKELRVNLLTPDEPDALAGILAFLHPKAEAIHAYLHERDIHIMHHAGRLRIAIHFYNTKEDIEGLIATLKDALAAV